MPFSIVALDRWMEPLTDLTPFLTAPPSGRRESLTDSNFPSMFASVNSRLPFTVDASPLIWPPPNSIVPFMDSLDPTPSYISAILEFLGYDPRSPGKTIGDKLRRRRENLGLSWEEAAEILGVNVSTVSRWEQAKRISKVSQIDVIRRFLKSTART